MPDDPAIVVVVYALYIHSSSTWFNVHAVFERQQSQVSDWWHCKWCFQQHH